MISTCISFFNYGVHVLYQTLTLNLLSLLSVISMTYSWSAWTWIQSLSGLRPPVITKSRQKIIPL